MHKHFTHTSHATGKHTRKKTLGQDLKRQAFVRVTHSVTFFDSYKHSLILALALIHSHTHPQIRHALTHQPRIHTVSGHGPIQTGYSTQHMLILYSTDDSDDGGVVSDDDDGFYSRICFTCARTELLAG